jgi:hypothetical protein
MSGANKYTVHTRLAMLENAVTELKKENAELRTHLWTALETKANDLKNVIQDSIRIPQDGAPGKDGRDGVDGQSIVGPVGPRGDVLIPNESEAQAALKEARLKLARKHAAFIAPIVRRLEFERTKNLVTCTDKRTLSHFWSVLRDIQEEISRLEQS